MSANGNHLNINACPTHAKRFESDEFMTCYFKDVEQTERKHIDGFDAIVCEVDNIAENNDTTYKIRFNCFSSCFRKKDLELHFIFYVDEQVVWRKNQAIQISANAGRDSGVFITKRKKTATSPRSGLRHEVVFTGSLHHESEENSNFPNLEIALACPRRLVEADVPEQAKRRLLNQIKQRIQCVGISMLNHDVDMFLAEHNSSD